MRRCVGGGSYGSGMRVVTWNVQETRPRRVTAQLEAVLERETDLVALQAVSLGGYAAWCAGLRQAGYSLVSSAELVSVPYPPPPYPKGIAQR